MQHTWHAADPGHGCIRRNSGGRPHAAHSNACTATGTADRAGRQAGVGFATLNTMGNDLPQPSCSAAVSSAEYQHTVHSISDFWPCYTCSNMCTAVPGSDTTALIDGTKVCSLRLHAVGYNAGRRGTTRVAQFRCQGTLSVVCIPAMAVISPVTAASCTAMLPKQR